MLTAIILAGGRSSRMGRPKASLPFGDEPLIVHITRALGAWFDELVVVAAPEQQLPALAATVVRDEVAYQGPVGGIYYGLRAASGDVAYVTSCDSPFPIRALISHLLSLRTEFDVVVPRWDGRFQPLSAVYRTTVIPQLEKQLSTGELTLVRLFDKVRTRIVDEEDIRRFDPAGDTFFSINTPDDYEEALRRWTRPRLVSDAADEGGGRARPVRR